MKKNLFFAAVFATALAGCSSDDNLATNEVVNEDPNIGALAGELVPVELGLNRSNSVEVFQTRGTGTVGSDDGSVEFQEEHLYVLMTTVDMDNAPWGFTTVGELNQQFPGTFYSKPKSALDADGNTVWEIDYKDLATPQGPRYYPTDGTYSEFYAFHVDDAAVQYAAGTDTPDVDEDGVSVTGAVPTLLDATDGEGTAVKNVSFRIDGTQDLLAGKAIYEDGETGNTISTFSAKTSRAGVIPNVQMQHLLTRFTFTVQGGDATTTKGLIVDSIIVLSRNEGDMTVAYDQRGVKDASSLVAWSGASDFYQDADGLYQSYTKDDPIWTSPNAFVLNAVGAAGRVTGTEKNTLEVPQPLVQLPDDETCINPVNVGEAMFVEPGQGQFAMKVKYRFPYQDANGDTQYLRDESVLYIRLADVLPRPIMAIGHSYNITIKVYGLSEIKLYTTLTAWEYDPETDNIEINTEDPEWTQANYSAVANP